MRYETDLAELLRPLGVYDLGLHSTNRGELAAYGSALDTCLDEAEETVREMSLTTAEGSGLERVEELLPYRPASTTAAQRRKALAALLRIGGDSFTLAAINDTLLGCGINARAREGDRPGYVQIYFPDAMGIPEQFDELRAVVEEIVPCHLEITYVFTYNTWGDAARRFPTWASAMSAGLSWYELSTMTE